jgi:hypothetical protein
MKKITCGLISTILIVALVGWITMGPGKSGAKEAMAAQSELGPRVVVATPMVKMSKKTEVIIMGVGFEPGQEVRLLFTTTDGVCADIEYALKPKPVANEAGTWFTTWSCSRYITKKIIKEGTYSITVTDRDYNFLCHAPVCFYAEKKPEGKSKGK